MAETKVASPDAGLVAQEPSAEEIARFLSELDEHDIESPGEAANLVGLLQEVQEHFGWLPAEALRQVSRCSRIPLSRIYGVVSFYAQFYLTPRGKHTIRCCCGTACHVNGAGRIKDRVCEILKIEAHQSTPDGLFYLETVACLGTCFLAPVMMIDDEYYGDLAADGIEEILDSYKP